MDEDVSEWFASGNDDDLDSWGFEMEVVSERKVPEKRQGTAIDISPLHRTVAEDFSSAEFIGALRRELAERYVVPLEEGLKITLNKSAVRPRAPSIIVSPELAPTVRTVFMDSAGRDVGPGEEPAVVLRLLCGVAEIEAPEAGWSVALNSRMVLLYDKTEAVGWATQNGSRIPAFHNQYGKLRGLVLLDATETSHLPWNTTKTQLDVDQAVYRRARREMVLAMEPVVKFLNRVKTEGDQARKRDLDPASRPLHRLFEHPEQSSAIKRLLKGYNRQFQVNVKSDRVSESNITSIQYQIDRRRVERAKRELEVPSNAQVGEETFEFWWRSQFD
ncbi:MAG: hypothetical protein ACTHO8_08130 [Solirubrobacterales bacterium]